CHGLFRARGSLTRSRSHRELHRVRQAAGARSRRVTEGKPVFFWPLSCLSCGQKKLGGRIGVPREGSPKPRREARRGCGGSVTSARSRSHRELHRVRQAAGARSRRVTEPQLGVEHLTGEQRIADRGGAVRQVVAQVDGVGAAAGIHRAARVLRGDALDRVADALEARRARSPSLSRGAVDAVEHQRLLLAFDAAAEDHEPSRDRDARRADGVDARVAAVGGGTSGAVREHGAELAAVGRAVGVGVELRARR
ncbi:MAG: hypothetical protein ACK55I_39135, partial [bacterium]